MAGYSGTPLPKKLGIGDGISVGIDGPMPPTLGIVPAGSEPFAVLLWFVTSEAALHDGIAGRASRITPAAGLWVCWPKKAARKLVPSDITEDAVRAAALPLGLVDNKVCAIDDVWSGLRLVWRKELRPR